MKPSRRRWLLVAASVPTIALVAFVLAYPGLSAAAFEQLRAGGLGEGLRVAGSLTYWATHLAELEPNPETGMLDFAVVRRRATSELDRARLAFHSGDFAEAVVRFERLLEQRGEDDELLFWTALAHLRLGEAESCLATLEAHRETGHGASPTLCSLPLSQPHADPAGARRAHQLFSQLLARNDRDADLRRWLTLFSALAAGLEPADAVARSTDATFRRVFLDHQRPAADAGTLRLADRAAEWRVDTHDAGKGVAIEDFDGDGDLDLVTGGSFDPLRFYRHDGNRFVERSTEAGFADILQPHVVTVADFDGDGIADLFVGSLFQPERLLRGRGDGSFGDATDRLPGPADFATFTWVSAWGDVEGDGDLDLFVARWGTRAPLAGGVLGRRRADSALYLNDAGRFVDSTAALGLADLVADRSFIGAAFADLDDDRLPELFLSSPSQRTSVVLANREGRRFEPVQRLPAGFTAAALDFDHDGTLELFQGGLADARSSTSRSVFGTRHGATSTGRTTIYQRSENGAWAALVDLLEDELPSGTMGASFGDLDNDGCHELYLGTGDPEPWFVLPNLLYSGRLDGRSCVLSAVNRSPVAGVANLQKGHGIVFFDLDGDGDQDLYSSLGGMWPGDRWPNQLFVSEAPAGRHWLAVRPSSVDGPVHGTTVVVRAVSPDGTPFQRTGRIDGKTGFGSGPHTTHLGLLDAVELPAVEVQRPGRRRVRLVGAPLDHTLVWRIAGTARPRQG